MSEKRKRSETGGLSFLQMFILGLVGICLTAAISIAIVGLIQASDDTTKPLAEEPARTLHIKSPGFLWAEGDQLFNLVTNGVVAVHFQVTMKIDGQSAWDIQRVFDIQESDDGNWVFLLVQVNRPKDIQLWAVARQGKVLVQDMLCSCGQPIDFGMELVERDTFAIWSIVGKSGFESHALALSFGDYAIMRDALGTTFFWQGIAVKHVGAMVPMVMLH